MTTDKRSVLKHLQVAQECLKTGNLAAADLLCRIVLDRQPDQSQALSWLNSITSQIGNYSEPPMAERFILIKAWGHGFWSEVSHVLGGLLLAEITGRIPIVHWGQKNLFAGSAQTDGFRSFFKPVSPLSIDDLEYLQSLDCFPQRWSRSNLREDFPTLRPTIGFSGNIGSALGLLSRQETLIVADYHLNVAEFVPWIPATHPRSGADGETVHRYLAAKYLAPTEMIDQECAAWVDRHLGAAQCTTIHLRGGDKPTEDPDIAARNSECIRLLDQLSSQVKIFGMTDDERYARKLKEDYRDRLVMTECERTFDTTGVHRRFSTDRRARGIEVMRDALIATRTSQFIGCGSSNVAAMIAVLREWPPGQCTLIGPSVLLSLETILSQHLAPEVVAFLH